MGIALVYHRVAEVPGDPRRQLVPAMGVALFATELRHLASRYRLVTGSELPRAAADRGPGEPFPIAITFDDDTRSHVDLVAPLLRSHGATATFYLTGASLQDGSPFWWECLQTALARGADLSRLGLRAARDGESIHEIGREIEGLHPEARDRIAATLRRLAGPQPPDEGLRRRDVEALAAAGFEIGFHTRKHYRLTDLEEEALSRALCEGRDDLESVSNRRPAVTSIAYPHGAADARVAAAARKAGFLTGYTGRHDIVMPGDDSLLLGRLSPSYRSLGELAFDIASAIVRSRPPL